MTQQRSSLTTVFVLDSVWAARNHATPRAKRTVSGGRDWHIRSPTQDPMTRICCRNYCKRAVRTLANGQCEAALRTRVFTAFPHQIWSAVFHKRVFVKYRGSLRSVSEIHCLTHPPRDEMHGSRSHGMDLSGLDSGTLRQGVCVSASRVLSLIVTWH